ncbi:MAG: CPBP family intramembrane metalloprotease [Clostridia bacterium]|nr:CPBP family intramembrane metalloprotease [Clostridia bacterium]
MKENQNVDNRPADAPDGGQQEARGRVQTRTPLFASLREWASVRLPEITLDEDFFSYKHLGRLIYREDGTLPIGPSAWAAILCAAVLLLLALWRQLSGILRPSGVWGVLLSLAGSLLCVLLPALLGASVSPEPCVRRRLMTAEQRIALIIAGASALCPMTLMADIPQAVLLRFGAAIPAQAAAVPPASLFLPMLLVSALIAPACEEMFFRGYLLSALKGRGPRAAAAVSALVFAAAHGADQFAARALLGLLLAAVVLHADSLAAGLIVHAMYNLSILLISFTGLGWLFSGLSLLSCAVRIAGTAVCFGAILRFWRARRPAKDAKPLRLSFTRRELLLAAAAMAALIASQIIAGVTGV